MMANNKLIVALDMASMDKVKEMVECLGEDVNFYKVGMELFYALGQETVDYLRSLNKEVFLDLKLHDIPNTVAQGVTSLTSLGASMITVHAAGGQAMMQATAAAADRQAGILGINRPKIVAITVLTSISQQEWTALGSTLKISEQVVRLARLAQQAGLDGVVASPQEAALIRAACGENFLIVTPGIQPQGSATNDQSRTATPAAALMAGANHLVIGRPITKAANPAQAAKQILDEMEEASCKNQR
jgi:orotidine-5'-phosphate decarboxylase